MNLHDTVRVRLTDAGRDALRRAVSVRGLFGYHEPAAVEIAREMEAGAPLWQLFYWFGPAMYMGNPAQVFERNEIEFVESSAACAAPAADSPLLGS